MTGDFASFHSVERILLTWALRDGQLLWIRFDTGSSPLREWGQGFAEVSPFIIGRLPLLRWAFVSDCCLLRARLMVDDADADHVA